MVRNTGETNLDTVAVRDYAETAGNTADDFVAVAKLSGGFVIGSTDKDNVLDPGKTWLFTSAGVITQPTLADLYYRRHDGPSKEGRRCGTEHQLGQSH